MLHKKLDTSTRFGFPGAGSTPARKQMPGIGRWAVKMFVNDLVEPSQVGLECFKSFINSQNIYDKVLKLFEL